MMLLASVSWLALALIEVPRLPADPAPTPARPQEPKSAPLSLAKPHPLPSQAPRIAYPTLLGWDDQSTWATLPAVSGQVLPRSIAGRVLNADGNPMIGVAVQARGELSSADRIQAGAPIPATAYTGADGSYTLTELPAGQYRIAAEVPGYALAEITASTGAQNADLVLEGEISLRVFGRLTDRSGAALVGGQVTVNFSPPLSVTTDPRGRYEVRVRLTASMRSLDLRFEHPNQITAVRRLEERQWARTGESELNVSLEPLAETTTVIGRLETTSGEPIAGETLKLYSPSLMRGAEGLSAKDGTFSIPDVALASDYVAAIRPRGDFQDLTLRGVCIDVDAELYIQLTPLDLGDLMGRVTDAQGKPISNFTLTLHNETTPSHTLPVTSDERGEFRVADVPLGVLVFQTTSNPCFNVTTTLYDPSAWEEIPIVLDLGPFELYGRVLDGEGLPLATRGVGLSWEQNRAGVRSTSIRRTVADADGNFRFRGLGSGPHTLSVQAPGFQTARMEQMVGAQSPKIVVRLIPDQQP